MQNMRKYKKRQIRRKKLMKKIKKIGVLMICLLLVCGLFLCGVTLLKAVLYKEPQNEIVAENSSEEVTAEAAGEEVVQEGELPLPDAVVDEDVIAPVLFDESAGITVKISAVGDCTLGTDVNFDQDTSFVAKYNAVGDPAFFFKEVRSVLADDDLTIANFEGTLSDRGSRKDKTYAFRGKPEYADILAAGSVEAANLANNHSFDYGTESYEDTKVHLSNAGITSFGYDRNAVMDINGVKVGLIGMYELADGLDCAGLLRENLEQVKADGAVLIIVSFHWGTEKEHYSDSIQKELAHIAIDEGAHLVLGHHPHVLQGIEVYKGRNIVYSLGNFCFGGNKNPSDKDTMIFRQTFTVADGRVIEDNNREIIPCSISSRADFNNYQPMVLEGEEAQRVLDRIASYSEGL